MIFSFYDEIVGNNGCSIWWSPIILCRKYD